MSTHACIPSFNIFFLGAHDVSGTHVYTGSCLWLGPSVGEAEIKECPESRGVPGGQRGLSQPKGSIPRVLGLEVH